MKKSFIYISLIGIFLTCYSVGIAQKERKSETQKKQKKETEYTPPAFPITPEMEKKVIEVTAPVRAIMEKILSDDASGMFQSYSESVKALEKIKSFEEKWLAMLQIKEKYGDFFREKWKIAEIDEAYYKNEIRNIFPPEIRETIQFTEFLNFTTQGNTKKHDTPEEKYCKTNCIKGTDLFFGMYKLEPGIIGGGQVDVLPNYIGTNTFALIAGFYRSIGGSGSDIRIPGTFAKNDIPVCITKSYKWQGRAFAISIIGCSFASIATTQEDKGYTHWARTWAPVIFASVLEKNEMIEYKKQLGKEERSLIRYGICNYSDAYGGAFGGSSSYTVSNLVDWTICEWL
jgi:hypothetical protein